MLDFESIQLTCKDFKLLPQDLVGLNQDDFSTENSNPMVAEDSTDQINQSIGFLVQPVREN